MYSVMVAAFFLIETAHGGAMMLMMFRVKLGVLTESNESQSSRNVVAVAVGGVVVTCTTEEDTGGAFLFCIHSHDFT
jgi:hypothetical protein